MVLKVLGPLDTGTEPLSPRERTVLSALVVRAGTTVASAELADAWWGDAPPRTWEQQVRNSIARIRARLGRGSVETIGVEYRLGLDPDAIDSVRFERLVSTARAHRLRGEHDRAVDAYTRALALWRGAPLQDVADWEPGVVEALRLTEIRASAEEELLDARLDAGEHRSLIADAERLLREEPLREDRWSVLALANYRADRQAEALALLRTARERLADELGIEPGPRLAGLELAILRRDPELDAPTPAATAASTCPYPGLRAFGPDDAEVFFGREADTETVLERIVPGAVVAIAGASGTGKSSLLLAGIVPRLRARGRPVEIVRPGSGGVAAVQRAVERAGVLAIDQAEELLEGEVDELARFGGLARAFLDGGGTVVVTIRSDALDRVRALPLIGDDVGRGVYLLGPLTDAAYRAAIELPARAAGLRVEPGLVELAVRDAGDRSSTLPHLSHAMQETWNRREGATLTVEGYRLAGGILGAIAQSAEDAFRALSVEDQSVCRSLMMRLIERTADGASTRRRVPVAPLLADAARRRVLERLTRARIVTVDQDAVTVAHEAVASAWPRLDGWLEEDAEGARIMRAVESTAAVWDAGGRDDDDLLRGARLHSALDWRDTTNPDLTPIEGDLLTASEDHERGEISELNARAVRDRRRNRVLALALSAAAVLLIAAVVAGGLAGIRGQEAAIAAENAQIEALVATSLALRSADRDVAALLAAEAYRRWPDDGRVRSALWGTMTAAGGLTATHRLDAARATVTAIPGTPDVLAIADSAGSASALVLDGETGAVVRTLPAELPAADTRFERNVAVSDDGRIAAVQTPRYVVPGDEGTCCWNWLTFIDLVEGRTLAGSRLLQMRTSGEVLVDGETTTAFLEHPVTGDLISVNGRIGTVRSSGERAFGDFAGEAGIYDALTVVDADRIATGVGNRVDVYDRRSLTRVSSIPLPGVFANRAMVSDGAGGLVVSGDEATARVDVDTGEILWQRTTAPSQICTKLELLADRRAFVCSSLGSVGEHSLADGTATGVALRTQLDTVVDPSVLADGTLVLAAPQYALWLVLHPDGAGPAAQLAARGMRLNDEPDDLTGLVPTVPAGGGAMRLWDFTTDEPTGRPSEWIGTLGGGVVERWDGDVGLRLENLRTGDMHSYRIDDLPDDFSTDRSRGRYAFVAFDGKVVAIDPATGTPAGPAMRAADPDPDFVMLSASETPEGDRALVTWWDPADSRTETAVFYIATGELAVEGLHNVDGTIVVSAEEFVAVDDETVQRVALDTLRPISNLPRAAGGSRALSLSFDGRTLLNVGWNHRLTLYDLTRDVLLGDPIDVDSTDDPLGGALSADGSALLTTTADGVLVWSLEPADQYDAACRLAGRELTAAEWSTYLADLGAQRATCDG